LAEKLASAPEIAQSTDQDIKAIDQKLD